MGAAPKALCARFSTLFFLGSLKAPGTWGSLAGSVFAYFLMRGMSPAAYAALALLLIYVSVGVCDVAERFFGQKDPGKINLDEFAAMPVCYFGIFCGPFAPASPLLWALLGFALFRFFDILKPLGINKIQNLDGGLGCVADDAAAGAVVCVILNVLAFFVNF